MPTSPSTRLALVGPVGTDTIAQGDDQIRAIITQLEAVGAGFQQGTSRPAAAAALAGYFYVNTSTGLLSYCTGSVWLDFQPRILIQTGTGTTNASGGGPKTITFAQAFADTSYRVVLQRTTNNNTVPLVVASKAAGSFTVAEMFAAETFDYIAIHD